MLVMDTPGSAYGKEGRAVVRVKGFVLVSGTKLSCAVRLNNPLPRRSPAHRVNAAVCAEQIGRSKSKN